MIELAPVNIPDFGVPLERPAIPAATYSSRCDKLFKRAGTDWVVVYADREHAANMIHLTGFEPRFEEALLLLGPGERRALVTGNESESYAVVSPLPDLEVVLAQSLSLMAQDRTRRPNMAAVLAHIGLKPGDSVGVVGWKYLEPDEGDGMLVPHALVRALEACVTGSGTLKDVTALLMHPDTGDRSTVDADQIAVFEWGASRASASVLRIVRAARDGMSELELGSHFGYAGEVLSCHSMLSSASSPNPVIGLSSPSARIMRKGDGITTAVGYWGGLSSRAALLTDYDADFLSVAKSYFAALITWYETARPGVTGGELHAAVVERLAEAGLRSSLNPGHLVSYDEWPNSPVSPGSDIVLRSGMPFQVDVIPVPMPGNWALNLEDGIVFADEGLRADVSAKHPAVMARIDVRRTFIADSLGIALDPTILPLTSNPLCLAPFWLDSQQLLVRS
ncbi:MAG: M24 family metallopeptidase [Devosia sp.]